MLKTTHATLTERGGPAQPGALGHRPVPWEIRRPVPTCIEGSNQRHAAQRRATARVSPSQIRRSGNASHRRCRARRVNTRGRRNPREIPLRLRAARPDKSGRHRADPSSEPLCHGRRARAGALCCRKRPGECPERGFERLGARNPWIGGADPSGGSALKLSPFHELPPRGPLPEPIVEADDRIHALVWRVRIAGRPMAVRVRNSLHPIAVHEPPRSATRPQPMPECHDQGATPREHRCRSHHAAPDTRRRSAPRRP